jgi:hypothetical protein
MARYNWFLKWKMQFKRTPTQLLFSGNGPFYLMYEAFCYVYLRMLKKRDKKKEEFKCCFLKQFTEKIYFKRREIHCW